MGYVVHLLEIVQHLCYTTFELKQRNVTICHEIHCGVIQFISCLFIIAVVPAYMSLASYDESQSIVVTSLVTSLGCIIGGFLTNLPLIFAPLASASIFLAARLNQLQYTDYEGNCAVIISGVILIIVGFFPSIMILFNKVALIHITLQVNV